MDLGDHGRPGHRPMARDVRGAKAPISAGLGIDHLGRDQGRHRSADACGAWTIADLRSVRAKTARGEIHEASHGSGSHASGSHASESPAGASLVRGVVATTARVSHARPSHGPGTSDREGRDPATTGLHSNDPAAIDPGSRAVPDHGAHSSSDPASSVRHDRPCHRPRLSVRTRSWSPAVGPSRKPSSPTARRSACWSSHSDGQPSRSLCSTRRICGSPSSRSRVVR